MFCIDLLNNISLRHTLRSRDALTKLHDTIKVQFAQHVDNKRGTKPRVSNDVQIGTKPGLGESLDCG